MLSQAVRLHTRNQGVLNVSKYSRQGKVFKFEKSYWMVIGESSYYTGYYNCISPKGEQRVLSEDAIREFESNERS